MLDMLSIIAQTTRPSGSPPNPLSLFWPLALMGLIFYFLLIRPQSREKKRRAGMIAALKKNDRVLTIGGILGTVTAVRDDEVTLKVDESSNTKITFSRASIQRVISPSATDSNPVSTAK